MNMQLGKIRETIGIALIALLLSVAVYSLLGLAWTFKTVVEATEKLKRSF